MHARRRAAALVAGSAAALLLAQAAQAGPAGRRGDLNGDGLTDEQDAAIVANHIDQQRAQGDEATGYL